MVVRDRDYSAGNRPTGAAASRVCVCGQPQKDVPWLTKQATPSLQPLCVVCDGIQAPAHWNDFLELHSDHINQRAMTIGFPYECHTNPPAHWETIGSYINLEQIL